LLYKRLFYEELFDIREAKTTMPIMPFAAFDNFIKESPKLRNKET